LEPALVVLVSAAVGAAIGYVTNVVAVWLLFHPRGKRCLLYGRLCVQGLVPSRYREIARRVAGLVEEYIASEGVWGRIRDGVEDAVREEIETAVKRIARKSGVLGLVAAPGLEALGARLASIVAPAVAEAAVKMVRRVEVGRLVEEELLRLGPEGVEEMFRGLAGRELRFVEISGALLGALVGLMQGLIYVFVLG